MKVLIYGSECWIGHYLSQYLNQSGDITLVYGEFTNPDEVRIDIQKHNPDSVVCCIEKSYGKNIWSTSYIENKLDINLHYNLYIPTVLADICRGVKMHYVYLGNGCIYKDFGTKQPVEETPNLLASSHSIVTGYTDLLVRQTYPECLYLRLRYPIIGDFHPKCYITKLVGFDKVLAVRNSVTVLSDMLPIIRKMLEIRQTGVYHMVNPGYLDSLETVIQYKDVVDNQLNIEEMDLEEHNQIVGERSNCIVDSDALQKFCKTHEITLLHAAESVAQTLQNMKAYCTPLRTCLCCQSVGLRVLLDLGLQPLANDFHKDGEISSTYPLCLMYCSNCYHCQLSHAINPDILFRNYKYVSGTSDTGKAFFKENAEDIIAYKGLEHGRVLDIACNDGSQLDYFKELGWDTYGVDPAENLCPIAEKKGHTIVCDFWTEEVAAKMPTMDVITAQNVFAHTQYLDLFLQACKLVMHENTSLYLQTSQRDMIRNGEFDTTYHEHISFYNTNSMNELVTRNGLVLNRVQEHSIHGRSYIFEVKLAKDLDRYNVPHHIEQERTLGLFSPSTYEHFRLGASRCVHALRTTLEKYKRDGYKIVGFGAAAKGQTLLCYGNIDLEYIVDENPLKIGLQSPKLNIPIVSLEEFREDTAEKILVVILAWNFAKEIKEKISNNKGDRTMVIIEKYFPDIILK